MCKNDMNLSLNGDTFTIMKDQFDQVLNRTIGNMEMKGADDATITLKLAVSLEKKSVGTFDGVKDVTAPTFKHDISSMMQVKDKVSGQLTGDYAMVWDDSEGKYVLRKIDNGQMNLFDDNGNEIVDVDYEVPAIGEGQRGIPESTGVGDNEEGDYSTSDESGNEPDAAEGSESVSDDPYDPSTPFGWLRQFIGDEMHVTEAMGNFTVRTKENKVVLSSATTPDNPFYCPAEKLEGHVGHKLACVGYGPDKIVDISIECEDCGSVIFDLDISGDDTPIGEETAEVDEAEVSEGEEDRTDEPGEEIPAEGEAAAAEDYPYEAPEA